MRVHSIYPAIQGEGCLTGVPMVLVRFQGCNLRCSFCDTKETWDPAAGKEMSIKEIAEQVQRTTQGHAWVLITGGEPAIQEDLDVLVSVLHDLSYEVAVEANGTLPLAGAFDCARVIVQVQ